jgi:hypothetical protein
VGGLSEVFFDPLKFVAGGGGVFPGWGGEDVDIKMVGEGDEGFDRSLKYSENKRIWAIIVAVIIWEIVLSISARRNLFERDTTYLSRLWRSQRRIGSAAKLSR